MDEVKPGIKKFQSLKKGDVVRMRIPYEENTPDYYNGYSPKEIRGELFKDKYGMDSKPRFVIVIGKDGNNLLYLPMTSRHSRFDTKHQYVLQDNSMTWKRDPDMKSYVEVSSLRAIRIKQEWDVQYFGRIAENDMANIMSQAGKNQLNLESKRDQRVYVSRNNEQKFEEQLFAHGFALTKEEALRKEYKKEDGITVTRTKWGMVKYHVPLSKEEVAALVAERESPPEDDFTRAVRSITESREREQAL